MERQPADLSSTTGARVLKDKIESFWRERGYTVTVSIFDTNYSPHIRSVRGDVRSDMKNGWPPRK
jgi:hypothetical protein